MDTLIPTDERLLGVWTLQLSPGITWLGVVSRLGEHIRCAYRIASPEDELRDEHEILCDLPESECLARLRSMASTLSVKAIGTPQELIRGETPIASFLQQVERLLTDR